MLRAPRCRALLTIVACATLAQIGQADTPTLTRREFAAAISKLEVGMPASAARVALGPPDDIWTRSNDYHSSEIKETWRYGTLGPRGLATLGQVIVDKDGNIRELAGKGTPPADGMFQEAELRTCLSALEVVPGVFWEYQYNPRKLVRAVNLLQPLGKERALAAIEEFLRVTRWQDANREGICLVLRTLFEVPEDTGYMPEMPLGALFLRPPTDRKLLPRFPIAIEGDIPFLLISGRAVSGAWGGPGPDIEYFRKHGRLRAKPLNPSAEPLKEVDRFLESPGWKAMDTRWLVDGGRLFLGGQVLGLCDSVCCVRPTDFGLYDRESRQLKMDEVASLRLRWNGDTHQYTFLDGTTLPKVHWNEVWHPAAGTYLKLTLARLDSSRVSAALGNYTTDHRGPISVFRVFNVNAKEVTLATLVGGGGQANPGRVISREFELQAGDEVQVELVVNEKSQLSPPFKP